MIKLGSHVSMNGREMLLGSVEEALSYGASTFMVYTGAPQNTRRRPIEEMRIEDAKRRMREVGIDPADVVVHAPYIINLANPDPNKRDFAVSFLSEEVRRAEAIGASDIVLHPGSHVKQGVEEGIAYVIDSLNRVVEKTPGMQVRIALETMSGKGTELGRSFEELRRMLEGVEARDRFSVCFDTCHTHDAGYDVRDDFEGVMETFDAVIGLEKLTVFHLNDSKNERGANKDRHANLGKGYIGFERIRELVHDPRYAHIPKILETPYVTRDETAKKREFPPYKEEIEMLREGRYDDAFIERIRRRHLKE